MRTASNALIIIMCLSLLTMQTSGLHMHVQVDGLGDSSHDTSLQGAHFHDAGIDGHDTDVDISSFESAVTLSKLIPLLIALVFLLLAASSTSKTVWRSLAERLPARHQTRWRPPLRAPPHHS